MFVLTASASLPSSLCKLSLSWILIYSVALPSLVYSQQTCNTVGEDTQGQPPIVLPIRNITLSDNAIRRGVPLSIGTPPQELVFEVTPYVNNLFVYPSDVTCGNYSGAFCTAALMGRYNYSLSTTCQPSFLAKFAPDTVNNSGLLSGAIPDLTADTLVSDILHFNEDTSLDEFPIDVNRVSGTGKNMLGVGVNSTVLRYLREPDKIKSNVWAYFEGLYGSTESENMDGHIVFGGYDAAKTSGPGFTQTKSDAGQGCLTRLMISVLDISIDIDGQPLSLLGSPPGSGIQMCIDPSFKLISLPLQVWNNLRDGVGGTEEPVHDLGINNGAVAFAADTMNYWGNLTLRLDSGLNISIPNHQLIQPERFLDENGTLTSTKHVTIQPLEEEHANDMPLLGHPFLAAGYLMVDNDNDKFTLWQSNSTTETKLVAAQPACQSQNPSTPSNSTSEPPGSSLSRGAIAGIAIGAIAGAIIIAVTAWLAFRYRQSHVQQQGSPDMSYHKAELSCSPHVPVVHELNGAHVNTATAELADRTKSGVFFGGELPADPVWRS